MGKKNHFKRNYNCLEYCGVVPQLGPPTMWLYNDFDCSSSSILSGPDRVSLSLLYWIIEVILFTLNLTAVSIIKKNMPLISQGQSGLPFWVAQSAARQGKRPSPCGAAAALLRRVRCPSVQGSVVHSERGSGNHAWASLDVWRYTAT